MVDTSSLDGVLRGSGDLPPAVRNLARGRASLGASAPNRGTISMLDDYIRNPVPTYRDPLAIQELDELLQANRIPAGQESYRALTSRDIDGITRALATGDDFVPNKPMSTAGPLDLDTLGQQSRQGGFLRPNRVIPEQMIARVSPMQDVPGLSNVNDFATNRSLLNQESLYSPKVRYRVQDFNRSTSPGQPGNVTLRPYLRSAPVAGLGILGFLNDIMMGANAFSNPYGSGGAFGPQDNIR